MTTMVTDSQNNYLTFIMLVIDLLFLFLHFIVHLLKINLIHLTVNLLPEINTIPVWLALLPISWVGAYTGGCGY